MAHDFECSITLNFIYLIMKYIPIIPIIAIFFASCTPKDTQFAVAKIADKNPIEELISGNEQFVAKLAEDKVSHDNFLKQQNGQNPQAVIITCSDSRIPPSLLFQKEIGDLFTIRTAGNIIGELEMASIEYAVSHLHTPLILVMGHTHCGAISAFIHHENAPEHIKIIMDSISKEKEIKVLMDSTEHHHDNEFVIANILHNARNIAKQSKIVQKEIQNGKLKIVAAIYDIETGKVSLLE